MASWGALFLVGDLLGDLILLLLRVRSINVIQISGDEPGAESLAGDQQTFAIFEAVIFLSAFLSGFCLLMLCCPHGELCVYTYYRSVIVHCTRNYTDKTF